MAGLKSILCLFDGDETQAQALDLALALGVQHKAFVHVLHVSEPIDPYLELNSQQEANVAASQSQVSEQIAWIVRTRSSRFGANLWRGYLNSREFHENGVGYEALTGYVEKVVPRAARTSDIVICSRTPVKKDAAPDVFMGTLMRSGRPVLLAKSYGDTSSAGELFGQDIAVAWDRSVQATRAIHNLLPFLQANARLHIVSVAEHNKKVDVRDDPAVMYWLKRHGFVPTVHLMAQGDESVAELLLSKTREVGAGLLAAGAYGQNALVEKLIGGTSVDLYRQAHVPLFLTH
jgi:nucleotide-binding universal stress UspA family protein